MDPSKCKQIPVSFSRNQSDHFFGGLPWRDVFDAAKAAARPCQHGCDVEVASMTCGKTTTKLGLEQNKKWLRETLGFIHATLWIQTDSIQVTLQLPLLWHSRKAIPETFRFVFFILLRFQPRHLFQTLKKAVG